MSTYSFPTGKVDAGPAADFITNERELAGWLRVIADAPLGDVAPYQPGIHVVRPQRTVKFASALADGLLKMGGPVTAPAKEWAIDLLERAALDGLIPITAPALTLRLLVWHTIRYAEFALDEGVQIERLAA